jgi:hypothetical protein
MGRTDDEWIALWDSHYWKERTVASLMDIAFSRDAAAEDRVGALVLLNEGIKAGLLPLYFNMPDLLCQCLLLASEGALKVRWWRRIGLKRRQQAISDRLTAMRTMVMTVSQFHARQQFQLEKTSSSTDAVAATGN